MVTIIYWTADTYERAFRRAGLKLEWFDITKSDNGGGKNDETLWDEKEKDHLKHHPTFAVRATHI